MRVKDNKTGREILVADLSYFYEASSLRDTLTFSVILRSLTGIVLEVWYTIK